MGKLVKFPAKEEEVERLKLGRSFYNWLIYWFHFHIWVDEDSGDLITDNALVGSWYLQRCTLCAKRRVQHLEVVK